MAIIDGATPGNKNVMGVKLKFRVCTAKSKQLQFRKAEGAEEAGEDYLILNISSSLQTYPSNRINQSQNQRFSGTCKRFSRINLSIDSFKLSEES